MGSTELSFPYETSIEMAASAMETSDNLIFRVSRVLGLFPFTSPQLEVSRPWLVCSIAVTGAVTVAGAMSFSEQHSQDLSGSYNSILLNSYVAGHILIFPCSLLKSLLHRGTLHGALEGIKDVQSRLERIGLRPIKRWTQLMPLVDISFFFMCKSIVEIVVIDTKPSLAYILFYIVAHFGMLSVSSQYGYLVDTIGDVFRSAVDFLNGLKGSVALSLHSSKVSEVVNVVNKLATVSEGINDFYSLQILLFMPICFCGLCINLYYICFLLPSPLEHSYTILVPHFSGAMVLLYVIWRVNQSSAETSEKSNDFNTALYKLMMEDKTQEIMHHGKLRLHISMNRELVFSACGFFNLDYAFLFSVLASAATYVVVLVQFGQSATV